MQGISTIRFLAIAIAKVDLVDVRMLEDRHRAFLGVREEAGCAAVADLVNETQLFQRSVIPEVPIPLLKIPASQPTKKTV